MWPSDDPSFSLIQLRLDSLLFKGRPGALIFFEVEISNTKSSENTEIQATFHQSHLVLEYSLLMSRNRVTPVIKH